MSYGSIDTRTTESPIDDVSYLTRSRHRIPTLVALSERPRSRSELWELADVSSSTIRRTLREFEGRNWIHKEGYQYETTELGAFVASTMEALLERMETERELRDVWHYVEGTEHELTIEMWTDATVTVANADDPYAPVNRFRSLFRSTTEFRFAGPEVALLEPCLDVFMELVDNGGTVTLIDRRSCTEYFVSMHPECSAEAVKRDTVTILEHSELPSYGIGLFDDRTAVICYEQDSGTVRAVIDTDRSAAREWAESVFERYHADARPLELDELVE